MGDLSERDVEDVLEGVQPPGRDDFVHVVELTTWLHASREIEPAPAMRDDLFSQIEEGLGAYQRSSRRPPAHLRHHRAGRRRLVREALVGSGRPIASLAAAAVLLVGVILTVRAGGPAREPSAFVSPSAQGLPTAGGDTSTTSTAAAPTTTLPREGSSEPEASPTTATTVVDSGVDPDPSTAAKATPESTTSSDTTSAHPRSRADDTTPPTTEEQRGEPDDDGAIVGSADDAASGRTQVPAQADPTDDTTAWNPPLSGWDFDLSEWLPARDLWAAVDEAMEGGEATEPGDDVPTGDDDPTGDRHEDGETESDRSNGADSERQDDGDPEREGSQSG